MGLFCAFPAMADNISSHYSAVGFASWYGRELQGHRTSDGERFNMKAISAASKTMPLPCYARVTNLRNGASMIVRVNDRGPFVRGRIVDISQRAADLLDIRRYGVAKVRVEYVGKAPPAGTDENFLLASLNAADQPADGVVAVARTAYAPELQTTAPALAALVAARRAANAPLPVLAAPATDSPFGDLAHSPFLAAEVASR